MKELEGAQAIQPKGQIEGTCSERFAAVREAFTYNLGSGQDIGASVAITIDGELVVDLGRSSNTGAGTSSALRIRRSKAKDEG